MVRPHRDEHASRVESGHARPANRQVHQAPVRTNSHAAPNMPRPQAGAFSFPVHDDTQDSASICYSLRRSRKGDSNHVETHFLLPLHLLRRFLLANSGVAQFPGMAAPKHFPWSDKSSLSRRARRHGHQGDDAGREDPAPARSRLAGNLHGPRNPDPSPAPSRSLASSPASPASEFPISR